MKIIYFGSDVFIDTFSYLLDNHEIIALYTYHNDEDYFTERNIVELARQNKIPVLYSQISAEEIVKAIENGCELFFSAEYSHKLPIPEHPGFHGLNIHSSLLPQGRSYYPIECAMERELSETGVTLHKLATVIDHGAILAQRKYPVNPSDDSIDIYLKSASAALEMTKQVMPRLKEAYTEACEQVEVLEYWKRPKSERLIITHSMTKSEAAQIYRKYNKMTMIELNGAMYFIDSFQLGNVRFCSKDIIRISDDRILYEVADGHLRLDIHPVTVTERFI